MRSRLLRCDESNTKLEFPLVRTGEIGYLRAYPEGMDGALRDKVFAWFVSVWTFTLREPRRRGAKRPRPPNQPCISISFPYTSAIRTKTFPVPSSIDEMDCLSSESVRVGDGGFCITLTR